MKIYIIEDYSEGNSAPSIFDNIFSSDIKKLLNYLKKTLEEDILMTEIQLDYDAQSNDVLINKDFSSYKIKQLKQCE